MTYRNTKGRLRVLLAAGVTAVVGSSLLFTPPAHAEDTDITVTPGRVAFTADGNTEIPDRQLRFGDRALINMDWQAANGSGFKTGDKFRINLGEYFTNVEYGADKSSPMKMSHPTMGEIHVGDCKPGTSKEVTCVFNEKIDELRVSYDNWHGNIRLQARASKLTDQPTVNISINDIETPLTLPVQPAATPGGQPGIGIRLPDVVPSSIYKSASLQQNSAETDYVIYMSGPRLKNALGDKLTFGDAANVITFRDSLVAADGEIDGGHGFATKPHPTDPSKLVPANEQQWILRASNIAAIPTSYHLDDLRDGPDNRRKADAPEELQGYELSVEFEKSAPHVALISIKGPILETYNYSVSYPTKVLNPDGIQEGTVYSNKLELLNSQTKFQLDKAYRQSIQATATADPEYGHFTINKRIAGDAERIVKKNHTVTVEYTYTLPLTADQYPGWTAPGTLNADNKTGTASCVINFRQSTNCVHPGGPAAGNGKVGNLLPRGSQVVITADSEKLDTISADIREQANWAKPAVKLPDDKKAYVEILGGDHSAPEVVLTNKATLKTGKFAVQKEVTGVAANTAVPTFNFAYDCKVRGVTVGSGVITGVTAGGAAVESDRAFPLGAECVITEEQPAALDSHELELPQPQTVVIDSDTTPVVARFVNNYTKTTATFKVVKTVQGLDAGVAVPQFAFDYSCVKGNEAAVTGRIENVVAGGEAVAAGKEFAVGSVCTVTEVAAGAEVEGYTLAVPAAQTVTVAGVGEPVVEAAFENVYTKKMGTFKVVKTVQGLDAGVAVPQFAFDYSCVKGNEAAVTGRIENVVAGGEAVAAGKEFAVGSVCTVTEVAAGAEVEGYTLAVPAAQTVTVAGVGEPVVEAAFENVYTKDVGSFVVQKTVTGVSSDVTLPAYDFHYSCELPNGDKQEGKITQLAAGATSEPVTLPAGTTCEITEAESAAVAGYNLEMPAAKQLQIQKQPEPAVQEFVNNYQPVPSAVVPVQPEPHKPVPKAELSKTGAETGLGALGVAATLLLGAGLVFARKRKA